MDTDLTSQLLAVRALGTQQSAAMAVLKRQHEMEMSLLQMVDQVARSAPPPGQGTKVDKLA
ncbi:MAG: hypothetical protein J0I99_05335 [Devosia sp.]|uniref:hypothetical protein n=1 Tax=Devosia sp. TaxID=1871048 RepID=UPI001AD26462|nr:hypothetical protein [Devosia sp.]MBN9310429.1 hypothetical protein [Devosia sp.]MBN9315139.1 hypothetical protein [Devosia sp.]